MNKIKAVIIEDEFPAVRLLNKMIQKVRPEWEVTVLPGTIEGAVSWFNENPHPDIIFLDIQLNDGISFTFIEQAQPQSMIVFTTAYDEYAVRAFTVNSISRVGGRSNAIVPAASQIVSANRTTRFLRARSILSPRRHPAPVFDISVVLVQHPVPFVALGRAAF